MMLSVLVIDTGAYATETNTPEYTEENEDSTYGTSTYNLGYLNLTKKDSSTLLPIKDVEFHFSKDRSELEKTNGSVFKFTTDKNGQIKCLLSPGTWYYKEVKASGYIVDSEIHSFVITKNKQTNVFVKNTSYGRLKILKFDEDNNNLNGAKFTLKLLGVEGNPDVIIEENFVVDGERVFNNLIPGVYEITETQAPDGFTLDPTPKTITVYPYTQFNTVYEVKFINNHIPKGFLIISKFDSKTLIKLQGAEFGVYTDVGCTLPIDGSPFVTGTNGDTITIKLDPGTYYVKETKAPNGYMLDDTVIPVVIKDRETVQMNMYNDEIPPTAGNYASTLLIGLLLAGLTTILYITYRLTKKRVH